jgi:signal transduction histidine kinase
MDGIPDEVALLISDLRHEVNNSLMAIIGYVELMLGRGDLPRDVVAKLEHVDAEANKIRAQIERTTFIRRPTGR